jgi:hypothetical protein
LDGNNKKMKLDMSLIAFENIKRKQRREELGLESDEEIELELEEIEEPEEVVIQEIIKEKQIFCSALLSL